MIGSFVGRFAFFAVLAVAALGCESGGSARTKDQKDPTQREKAAQLNAQLGTDYFRQGNWSEAKSKLERALEQDSRNVQANMMAGLLFDQLGEQSKAESYFRRAVSLDEKNPETHNFYAVFLCRHGKNDAGEKQALIAASDPLYKTPESALLNAGTCARNGGNLANAEKHFRRALQLQPRFAPALFEMADLNFRANQLMPARAFLERNLAASPAGPRALLLAYKIEAALGNRSVAADYARRLRNDFTTSDEAKALAEIEHPSK